MDASFGQVEGPQINWAARGYAESDPDQQKCPAMDDELHPDDRHPADCAASSPGDDYATKITVEWTETFKVTAMVNLDQAREVFGLGGTPDREVEEKVRALLAWNAYAAIRCLARFGNSAAANGHQLLAMNGVPRGDW
jgi:hypothetical protein